MKKLLAAILSLSIVFVGAAPIAVNPQDYVISASAADDYTEGTYDVLKYKNYGDYIEISDCDEETEKVVIPSEIDGVPVTSIGNKAFKGCDGLTSVNIPNSVTSIGNSAFDYCRGLTSITIPDSVTSIGDYVFEHCSALTSITIPDSVISIGIGAFKGCLNLTEILVDENSQYYSSINGVMFNKDKTTILAYPCGKKESKYVIPNGVKIIGDYAFYLCKSLISVTIPYGVTIIGDDAFYSCCELTSVNIPVSVTSIDNYALAYCALTSIIIPESVTSIAIYTFEGFSGTMYGFEGSYAQTYAEENGFKFSVIGMLGDVDDDGAVNSSDASLVLREYALIATGEAPTFSEFQKIVADVNKDSIVDSSDASVILAYYAYTSTGGTDSITDFIKK